MTMEKDFVKKEDQEEEDAEVMQVVGNGPLRSKKLRKGEAERPMSWEGELSDDELMHTPPPPQIVSEPPLRPLGSPMCMDDAKAESNGPLSVIVGDPPVRIHHVVPCNVVPSSTSPFTNERATHGQVAGSNYDTVPVVTSRSNTNPLMGYSPSPSPVLARPTSSSSSRSSYSPSQSPLMGRYAYRPNSSDGSPQGSPLQSRHIPHEFSPSQSPSQGRRTELPTRHRPYSVSPGLQKTSDPYDPHLGVQSPLSQHTTPEPRSTTASSASVHSSASDESNASDFSSPTRRPSAELLSLDAEGVSGALGVSRQQLLSGPCPVCGDRISGFHYGIFSCESCKGFFKRTVQNKKNYVCLRGAGCHVSVGTRKKCPACRFNKCLRTGMKLEAIREDRTRGGRSTYQCSYTLPVGGETSPFGHDMSVSPSSILSNDCPTKPDISSSSSSRSSKAESAGAISPDDSSHPIVPRLIQDILSVEHLWHYSENPTRHSSASNNHQEQPPTHHPLQQEDQEFLSNLCNVADNRLYKIVKWCKSLPLFREIGTDDQIALLINSWCELLLLSCCHRSMSTPNEIRVSHEKSITLAQAQAMGLSPVIERMFHLTEHLRRLQVDQYEYVSLKVIILLTSDAHGLKECEKVRSCQKEVLEALQNYTASHYPQQPAKFGELLLRLPELERACQVGKDSLTAKQRTGDLPSFNLLMELLRGDQ